MPLPEQDIVAGEQRVKQPPRALAQSLRALMGPEHPLPVATVRLRDMPNAQVVLGQPRGRRLSVAASKFVDQIGHGLTSRYTEE